MKIIRYTLAAVLAGSFITAAHAEENVTPQQ